MRFRTPAALVRPEAPSDGGLLAYRELYETPEIEGIQYAIRLPANGVLQERIGHVLTRPVGKLTGGSDSACDRWSPVG